MTQRYFGTDGIRGKVGQFPMVPDFMVKLGWAIGTVLKKSAPGERPRVVLGKDTRISGYLFESALQSGFIAAGVDILLLGPMPTPGIAYLTRDLDAAAGIVISASHNPYGDNGIKVFDRHGEKLDDALELAIEALCDQPMQTVQASELGKASRVTDAQHRYQSYCLQTVKPDNDFSGWIIALDCANGACYQTAPQIFQALGMEVLPFATAPDGFNINDQCGSTYLASFAEKVKQSQACIGIAFDGDGDRVLMVDEQGECVDGDELLFVIAESYLQQGKSLPGVVGTLMSNLGLELALQEKNINFTRAKVGDRYVLEQLKQNDWFLGGEASGHLINLHRTTTGDGIISALQVLSAMARQHKPLHVLKQGMTKLPQQLINVKVSHPKELVTHPSIQQAVQQAEEQLGNNGRVLLRASGTEPVIRVMVEGKSKEQIKQVATQLATVVEQSSVCV